MKSNKIVLKRCKKTIRLPIIFESEYKEWNHVLNLLLLLESSNQ